MISQVNNTAIAGGYKPTIGASKESSAKSGVNISSQGDTSKVQQIKEALESGEYKIDLQALSQKIAQELL